MKEVILPVCSALLCSAETSAEALRPTLGPQPGGTCWTGFRGGQQNDQRDEAPLQPKAFTILWLWWFPGFGDSQFQKKKILWVKSLTFSSWKVAALTESCSKNTFESMSEKWYETKKETLQRCHKLKLLSLLLDAVIRTLKNDFMIKKNCNKKKIKEFRSNKL